MLENKEIKARLKELNKCFEPLPEVKKTLLKNTIETVAFMDIQLKELESIIANGGATTPDKQLYSSMAKTRDVLMKKLIAELPEGESEEDILDNF